jgi:glutathione synthase
MAKKRAKKNLAVVIDPLPSLNPKKDSTLVMMESAQRRRWNVYAFTPDDLFVENSVAMAHVEEVRIDRKKTPFAKVLSKSMKKLEWFDFILMRKDPPFDTEYIYAASILDLVNPKKTLVSNRAASLRLFNEKFLISTFPEFAAPTLFTKNHQAMLDFIRHHQKCVVKPMDVMGGRGVFVVSEKDLNRNVILETVSENFTKTVVIQKYISEIKNGDRRILIIGGEPVEVVLVRKPSSKDHRGNLAAGASAHFSKLTSHERYVVGHIRPFLFKHGLHLVGLDMIGSKITEINFTSPTGLVEISKQASVFIEDLYLNYLEHVREHMLPYNVL